MNISKVEEPKQYSNKKLRTTCNAKNLLLLYILQITNSVPLSIFSLPLWPPTNPSLTHTY